MTEEEYNRVVHGLTECYTRLADAAWRSGDVDRAGALAEKALV